jgi:hypothetical protein
MNLAAGGCANRLATPHLIYDRAQNPYAHRYTASKYTRFFGSFFHETSRKYKYTGKVKIGLLDKFNF